MNTALPFPVPTAGSVARPDPGVMALTVFVRGLRIEAEVGVNADEFGRRQPLVIDVELELAPPVRCEHIAETVNYEVVVAHARAIAGAGHVKLIETFAMRLAEAMLTEPHVNRARVRIEKPQALAPDAEAAGVDLMLAR